MATGTTGRKVFVIIDATHERHLALERLVITSEIEEPDTHIPLFISVDGERCDLHASNDALYRDDQWLKSRTKQLKGACASYCFELCWSSEWQKAVLRSAQRFNPDHIFMPTPQDNKKSLFSNQQWVLLRTTGAPVSIVRSCEIKPRRKLFAAINIQKQDDPAYARLNEKILARGQQMAGHYGAYFYVINAYKDNMHYPVRHKVEKIYGLPSNRVPLEEGDPTSVISRYAKEIDADTVVIGTMARQGLRRSCAAIPRKNSSISLIGM